MVRSISRNMLGLLSLLLIPLTVYGVTRSDVGIFSQSLKIGGSNPAVASAALDISSITKGLLIPRMTEAQRDAISSPATGLQVFNTDDNVFNYWDGDSWEPVGSGDMVGPGSSTDNALAVWDGTTGKLLQDSSATLVGNDLHLANGQYFANSGYGLYLNGYGNGNWGITRNGLATDHIGGSNISIFTENIASNGVAIGPIGAPAVFEVTNNGNAWLDGILNLPVIDFTHQGSTPSAPASGHTNLFLDDADDRLYTQNSSGQTFLVGAQKAGPYINMLANRNNDAELGSVFYWTNSGGGTRAVSNVQRANGVFSMSYDAAANGNYMATDPVAIPDALKSKNCFAQFHYKGFDSNITASVHDGANIITSQTLSAQSDWQLVQFQNFTCPSSGNLEIRWTASADAAIGYVDEVYLGSAANISNVSQAKLLGKIKMTGCTDWSRSNTSYGSFSATSGCSYTLTGNALAPSTVIPAIRFASIDPGYILVFARGYFGKTVSTTNADASFRFNDGTSTFSEQTIGHSTSSGGVANTNQISGSHTYTSAQTNVTIDIQASVSNTASSTNVTISDNGGTSGTNNAGLEIEVWHFPLASQSAISASNQPWRVDATISGANPSLGTANVSSYTEITDGSLTLTNNTGTNVLSAQIPCSTTNASSGTTCSVGSESVGVAFTIPRAGDAIACVNFAHEGNPATSVGANFSSTFQIVETPNNAQTISQEGKSRLAHRLAAGNATSVEPRSAPMRLCGTFTFASAGLKTLRLMYEQLAHTGSINQSYINGDAGSTRGQPDIHWEVYPIDQQQPAPILVGSVHGGTTGQWRTVAAAINSSGVPSDETGDWINGSCAVSNTSQFDCAVNSGIFSGDPVCTATVNDGSTGTVMAKIVTANTTSSNVRVFTQISNANTASAQAFALICMGPR